MTCKNKHAVLTVSHKVTPFPNQKHNQRFIFFIHNLTVGGKAVNLCIIYIHRNVLSLVDLLPSLMYRLHTVSHSKHLLLIS